MGIVQHRQIAEAVRSLYAPHVDVTDFDGKAESDRELVQLSRGLAAYALSYLTGVDAATTGASVTDGFRDNGIDAILYDSNEKNIYLVQSKWNTGHSDSVSLGDTLKFLKGARDLLNSRFDRFNTKIKNRSSEIDSAINQANKVVLVICYSGSGDLSRENAEAFENFVEEVDETRQLVSYQVVRQSNLHDMLLQGAAGSNVSASIQLFEWGQILEPIRSYYGQIAASELVVLHEKYGPRLFAKNIRMFLGDISQVNSGIQETILGEPERFWFLNNGITALAASVRKTLAGGGARAAATFECDGLSVVNGAQTIGSIAVAAGKDPEAASRARVPIRIVSLEGAPEGFAAQITRTNNTQNRIDSRNFVALDPEQERLRAEFAIDNIDYEYRQGEIESSSPNRLGLVEATIALACTDRDVDLAVQAKREIGKLWEDIGRSPYQALFRRGISADAIWRRVLAFRRIDNHIGLLALARGGKSGHIMTHGNRFLAAVSYRYLSEHNSFGDFSKIKDENLHMAVNKVVDATIKVIDENYPENYVASLFKNLTKCREMALQVKGKINDTAGPSTARVRVRLRPPRA